METHTLLGRRIRSLRKARGLTQQQLGELADLNYKYLGAVERGEENPSVKVLERIATALEVELIELFRLEHEEANPKVLRKSVETLLARADPEQLQVALKLLKAILD